MAKLIMVLCLLLVGCGPKCKVWHYETQHVPRSCHWETFGSPGMPYPLGDGVGGVKMPMEVCQEAYDTQVQICDEWEKK